LEQERGPRACALRWAFEECGSCIASGKRGSELHVLYLHEHGSHILEQKYGPYVWALRRAFEVRGSRVTSKRHGSEPGILHLQNRLQL